MGGVARADAVVVLAKGDVHDPVGGVLDAPMPAHRPRQGPGFGGQVGNEAADIRRDPVAAATFELDPDQAGQVAPLRSGSTREGQAGSPVTRQRRFPMRLWSFPTVSA